MKPQKNELAVILLILLDMIPIIGVLFFDWHASAAAVIYWVETVILAFYLILNTLFSNTWFASLLFVLMYGVLCSLFGAYITTMHVDYMQLDLIRPQPDPATGFWHNFIQFYAWLIPRHIPGISWIAISLLLFHGIPFIKVRMKHKRIIVDYKHLPIGAMNIRMFVLMLMTGVYAIFLKTGWALLPLAVIVFSKLLLDIAIETRILVIEKTQVKKEAVE